MAALNLDIRYFDLYWHLRYRPNVPTLDNIYLNLVQLQIRIQTKKQALRNSQNLTVEKRFLQHSYLQ